MKGIEKAILGIMLLIIALIIVVGIFILPMMNPQKQTNQEINFRLYCIYWRQKQYLGTTVQTPDAGIVDMTEACTKELGIPMNSQSDWNKCIAACKLVNSTSA
jgi:hypothetical protein